MQIRQSSKNLDILLLGSIYFNVLHKNELTMPIFLAHCRQIFAFQSVFELVSVADPKKEASNPQRLTKGVQQKLSFLSRTKPSMDGVLYKVEERLGRVVPNIVGKEIIQEERELFSLPLRMGGLNIALPQHLHKNLEKSIELSTPFASFNNESFEIQQRELEQTKISLRQKADMKNT